jgi:hypothetical protein
VQSSVCARQLLPDAARALRTSVKEKHQDHGGRSESLHVDVTRPKSLAVLQPPARLFWAR